MHQPFCTGGRGGGPGRRGRERDEEEEAMSSRPSGPATLFDFLETKIPSKQGNLLEVFSTSD